MSQIKIKILTFLLIVMISPAIFAGIVNVEKAKTHLRLKIFAPKDLLVINKKNNFVTIKSLDPETFKQVSNEIENLKLSNRYIKSINEATENNQSAIKVLNIELANSEIELFSFYKDRDKNYVLDFWSDSESLLKEESKVSEVKKEAPKKSGEIAAPKVTAPKNPKLSLLKRPKNLPKKKKKVFKKKKTRKKNTDYRDFRYGASSIWDYQPLSPKLKTLVNLARKTPEYLFPIKNRKYQKGDKEAHLQLTINLYRKKKWGLMYKSMKLFSEKYGDDDNVEILEYMKANAIIRENLDKGSRKPVISAMAMLTNLAKMTKNYELKKGILKYLITYKLSVKDYVQALDFSKKFYVASKENFDYEESGFAAEGILYCLTKLRQIEKLREVVADKTLKKLVPAQIMIAYEIYTLLLLNKTKEAINVYLKNKSGLVQPAHPTILYNVAESYFREAQYEKSIKLFDNFLSHYSYFTEASAARLRLALSYEILDKNFNQTSELYKNAINKSQDKMISYEARLRYVALRTIRNLRKTDKDDELRVLLETDDLEIKRNQQLKKLLWLVRMRGFLADGEYVKALSYLNAIPLNTLTISERRVLEGDGAEAIYGIMLNDYKKGEYSRVIKAWEIYKEKYVRKVATDAYLNFIVGKSYIKTGLYNGFDEVYASFQKLEKTPQRTFPIWVERSGLTASNIMLHELSLIKNINMENWELALRSIKTIATIFPGYKKTHYYRGIVNYKTQNFKGAVRDLENYISFQSQKRTFDPSEIAEMLLAYTDSLYKVGNIKKYKKAAKAILEDTENFGLSNEYVKEVKERITYLLIEIMAGESKENNRAELIVEIRDFLKQYKKSNYRGRLQYLLGLSLVDGQNEDEGVKIFKAILEDKDISNYIKEMVKSELSLINIKNKTI